MVWGETVPSGRERAIETLVDMEPHGPFYRAARVLEEAVPQALLHRPNLVTKAALVEQAYSLSKYELDKIDKYDDTFGDAQNACFSDRQKEVVKEDRERILRHIAKVTTAKRGTGNVTPRTAAAKHTTSATSVSPSPQLVAALRHLYGGKDDEGEQAQQQQQFDKLRSLLKSVMDHPAFVKSYEEPRTPLGNVSAQPLPMTGLSEEEEEESTDIQPPTMQIQLESLIANVCQVGADEKLHGLLITVLSVLTSTEVREEKDVETAKGKTRESRHRKHKESDPIPMPALQVGSLLSMLKPDEDDRNSWRLDPEMLSYFGKAAASYEERIEIQKARLLARLEETQVQTPQPTATISTEETDAIPATPIESGSAEAIAAASVVPDDNEDEQAADAAAAALSAAVFEQIISAATGDETSSNEDGAGESSESDSDEDQDSDIGFEESDRQALENNGSSSSSSGSEAEPGEEEQGESEEEDDDIVLRQALALSLVEQNQGQALRVDTTSQQDEEQLVIPDSTTSSGPVTPGNETPISVRETDVVADAEDSPLPQLPTPPKFYPYATMLSSNNDPDEDGSSQFLDPSALSRFGMLPAPHVLVHLLRYTVMIIERRKFRGGEGEETSSTRKDGYSNGSIAGGVGCSLFPPTHEYLKSSKSPSSQGTETGVSVQLLVALFLLILDKRNDAIENLRKACAQENRAMQEGDDEETEQKDGSSGTPLSNEGDDPAIALALNYVDEDVSESKESLEAKGMHRKAAAAAHDAAEMLKSLKRRTEGWKEQVKLYSQCALISMKSLRLFLQCVVRRWLQERRGLSAVACDDFLPTLVASKLSMGLAALASISTHSSSAAILVGGDDGEVEELFMPLRLYREAMMTWGECVPLVYPSVTAQAEILRSLLTECSKAKAPIQSRSLESLLALPVSDMEPHFHRLQVLCRRLRVSDLLDGFVSSPECYLPEVVASDGESDTEAVVLTSQKKDPQLPSPIVALVGSSLSDIGGMKGELSNFYLALCHRCHERILLWDGLFASTEPESDEAAVSMAPSSGDMVRVGVNPSNNLQFDATKCSDSIAILANHGDSPSASTPNGSSVHQRASKVWGTVLSSNFFSPKTGIHRWAVRLDKCERGHVFVGVSTSQASMRTYVGGDKYGWGMIGTQALWHDRRKIRGDYGSTFRTGSTIIVTLDTDAGTLSFSSWKDSSSSTSFALDPLVQNLSSPRRHGHIGGTIEDWGVAFEGLPLDSKLYPAVGLYQRDDRVTLLTVESGGRSTSRDSAVDATGGLCYFPRLTNDVGEEQTQQISQVRRFNDLLSWDGVQYVSDSLQHILTCLKESDDEFLLTTLLPSLCSALCLVPSSIPVLSERCALTLLPRLTDAVKELEQLRGERQMVHRLFRTGMQEGKWVIRATGSSGSSSDSEEYVVDFSGATNEQGAVIGFEGTGVGTTGKSKNGLVAIFGTVKGSSVHFVEEWTDGNDEGFSSATSDETASSCVVAARLSLDGKKFEGTYRNVQFGTTGKIAGLHCSDRTSISKFRLKDAPASSKQSAEFTGAVVTGEALLCLAHSHMATIISEDAGGDHAYVDDCPADSAEAKLDLASHRLNLKRCLTTPFMSRMSLKGDGTTLLNLVESIRELYSPPPSVKLDASADHLRLLNNAFFQEQVTTTDEVGSSASYNQDVEDIVANIDDNINRLVGGKGSLSGLCPAEYQSTRRLLVCAFVHHCRLGEDLAKAMSDGSAPTRLQQIWGASLKVMEDGVRRYLSAGRECGTRREQCMKVCALYSKIATFLLSLENPAEQTLSVDDAVVEISCLFTTVESEADLDYIASEMSYSSKRALLRLVPIVEVASLLSEASGKAAVDSPVAIESLAIGIPRLLGRGYPERLRKQQDGRRIAGPVEGLGAHYLSNLAGSASVLRRSLRRNALGLIQTLGKVIQNSLSRRGQSNSFESLISVDSMTLALLASFISVLLPEDAEEVAINSGILSIISDILREHRDHVPGHSGILCVGDDEKSSVVRDLHTMGQREVSRSLLRSSVAAAHVIIYQVSRQSSTEAKPASLCLDLLIKELGQTLPRIESAVAETSSEYRRKQANSEWEKWCELSMKAASSGLTTPKRNIRRHQVGRSGVNYLLENGMLQATTLQTASQKSSSRSRGNANSSAKASADSLVKLQGNFFHQYLSHWLHILAAVSKVSSTLKVMAEDARWLNVMLRAAGLEPELDVSTKEMTNLVLRKHNDGMLPGRYRSRVLRLLLPLLSEVPPSEAVVKGLFRLVGATSSVASNTMDDDDTLVSREAVSLLRNLHSPARILWRDCINQAIDSGLLIDSDEEDALQMQIGILSFFNGCIDGINRGSYVLLKPAAAAPLAADQQATPSSKSHSSSVGGGSGSGVGSTPHHVVGNGTEGIVAGLCRADAAAGIVSNIDMKNGICEVILLNRNRREPEDVIGTIGLSSVGVAGLPTGKVGSKSRHTLTVRALRSPLSDVVQAQEVPLFLDESMPVQRLLETILCQSINTLANMKSGSCVSEGSESTKDCVEAKASTGDDAKEGEELDREHSESRVQSMLVLRSVLALRASTVVLSDDSVLAKFLGQSTSREMLSGILQLSSYDTLSKKKGSLPEASHKKFLSSLPIHEARCGHLLSLYRALNLRVQLLRSTENSEWESRLSDYNSKKSDAKSEKDSSDGSEGNADGSKAQPSESGTIADAPPVLSSSGGSANERAARNTESISNRGISQSTAGSENSEDDEDSEAAATAAAHLREAAIAQMAELGLPRSWSELALRRTGGTNIEAAVHFCLERGGEMERLLAEERERERMMQRQSSGGSSSRRRGNRSDGGTSNHLLRQLLEMGFPSRWCAEALAATGNNVDEALTWILTNGERLSAEDEGMEEEDEDEDEDLDEDDEEEDSQDEETVEGIAVSADEGNAQKDEAQNAEAAEGVDSVQDKEAASASTDTEAFGWNSSVIPLRFISGRSIIDPRTLAISGLPTGGFSSVGTKGVLLTSGKWYYEAILETAGCLQIGWADGSFAGHCHADRGDGCGDGPSSWAYDGWRRYRWHATATEWGCRWKEGDVVGCLVDMDERVVSFTLNGRDEEIGMGVAFSGNGFRPCGGVYACVSFNRREKLRLILGGGSSEPFKYDPPAGYRGVGEAVIDAVKERDILVAKEGVLDMGLSDDSAESATNEKAEESKRFLCDFSDGEHGHELMAWAHRYYGSDASVHLGSGRAKQSSGSQKSSSSSSSADTSIAACVSRRVEKVWSKQFEGSGESDEDTKLEADGISSQLEQGYNSVAESITRELVSECTTMAALLARKLLLHVVLTRGENFDPSCCFPEDKTELSSAIRFWKMIEASASLRCAGWVGEAGAMAIAAEALGLGISSNDHTHSRHSMSDRAGIASISDLDDGMMVPAGGITQLMSSVLEFDIDSVARATGSSLAASAEASIGSDGGGGVLVFLLKGLQSAVSKSCPLRRVVVAAIRRSVRLLAVVEYDGDDAGPAEVPDDDDDLERSPGSSLERTSGTRKEEETEEHDVFAHPDARLASFLTGLLLSKPVEASMDDYDAMQIELFEAWSVGMLSASLPWRMVCAFTAAGILNRCPRALKVAIGTSPTLSRFYGRLRSTVSRRVWAERAAIPVCSRYAQAMIELLACVKRAVGEGDFPEEFMKAWRTTAVDAATPLPVPSAPDLKQSTFSSWEAEDGWVSSDVGWEIWTGAVEYMAVDWKTPSRSAVRTLMDGGDGPPMLREGCTVMRGLDWEEGSNNDNEDGKDVYEAEKAKRESEKRASEEEENAETAPATPVAATEDATSSAGENVDPTEESQDDPAVATSPPSTPVAGEKTCSADAGSSKKKKKKKTPSPKLPLGTVLSIEPWNGIPSLGRKVRWHLTGKEGIYRYGGDGGRYDISHVEVNEKATRVRKRHPLPESAEQCAARHGFGAAKRHSVLLRLRRTGSEKTVETEVERHHQGILEWPDFGAGVLVDCLLYQDGAVKVVERDLLYGSKDSGWEARFGQPSFVPGTEFVLTPTVSSSGKNQADVDTRSPFQSLYEEMLGSSSFLVDSLRNRADGGRLRVTSEMRLFRGRGGSNQETQLPLHHPPLQAALPPPIHFDRDYHASSLALSRDGRTVSCVSADGRGTAFASVGFTKGMHYWEVKLEQADIGSVFIGVAEKPTGSGGSGSSFGYDSPPRLNRWHGWGFVNFRATYTAGAERVYGAHCHAGDTVGVLLDCDAGRLSFFFDGLKYGEHILNDLGCAFENISPFGFNVDGCGSGGAGQGAPSGIEGGRGGRYPAQGAVRPRALWPVVGLRNHGDRVTISSKWVTGYGVDGSSTVDNCLAVDELLCSYSKEANSLEGKHCFPSWFIQEAFSEFCRWQSASWYRSDTRGCGPYRSTCFGLDLDLDASPLACASASATIGLNVALLAGDRVRLTRSAGRVLELAEEAVVLGAYQGRLFYRIVSQKSEGGSLTEGGGRSWCWDESEVVDGLPFVNDAKGLGVELPLLDRFKCTSPGGLKIVYEGGAVVRSDLEIFDGSLNLGTIPVQTVIPQSDVLERRVNSCGVVRYRVRYEKLGEGWISSRIRGGKEEAIVEPVHSDTTEEGESSERSFTAPHECASEWFTKYEEEVKKRSPSSGVGSDQAAISATMDLAKFESLVSKGFIPGFSMIESDSLLARAVSSISDFSEGGDAVDAPFDIVHSSMSFALASVKGESISNMSGSPGANQSAASVFANVNVALPSLEAIMARAAVLRAFNRRARLALPWLPLRPCQEGAAILGGIYGHGASIDRAGRNRLSKSQDLWVKVPSIASRIRCSRGIFFNSVKRNLLHSITEATTTPTPLSHDEYELPREIRTVRINRLKARRAVAGTDVGVKRKHSVFAQLHNETKGWGGAALRRGFVAKGHGGQKRAFKVKLIGEGVNDYSGPYREAFTDAMREIVDLDQNGKGSLGVLDPSPNNASETGDNRDLFMFSLNGRNLNSSTTPPGSRAREELRIRDSFSSLITARDEASREVEEALVFLGRISGTAFRHGIPVDLPLPLRSIWSAIVEEITAKRDQLNELDTLANRQQENEDDESPLLLWQQRMLNSFVEGLSNVLPVEVLTIFTGEELREIVCGNSDIDVDLLRRVVEYEGYDESADVVRYFWETLREITNEERKAFLQFVWARNRLPTKESDFDAPFKIQKDTKDGDNSDQSLPSASTCFFSLALPEYSSKEILKEKLLFAINNVTTMETDFQTNSAEIAEGYRAF